MTVRSRSLLAAAVGACLALPAAGQEPARLNLAERGAPAASTTSHNQQIADAVAQQLRQCEQLRQYCIDIAVHDGVAELAGSVVNPAQRDAAVAASRRVSEVIGVRDRLTLSSPIAQAQALSLEPSAPTGAAPVPPPPPRVPGGAMAAEPTPTYQGPTPSPYDVAPPRMPPYAWPTYAPYNNYSRVAYPNLYPYNAWPYIGPISPFPKIPPGWRSVKLEWQDGYWWYSTHSNSHCWWRLRYW